MIEFTIKNYRCFTDDCPARFTLDESGKFTAFVGTNNAGKSTILKFFYEFRGLFGQLKNRNQWTTLVTPSMFTFSYPNMVVEPVKVFSYNNTRDICIEMKLSNDAEYDDSKIIVDKLILNVSRDNYKAKAQLYHKGEIINLSNQPLPANEDGIIYKDQTIFLSEISSIFDKLSSMVYIPAFRNILNLSGDGNKYYDINVGKEVINIWRQMKTGDHYKQNKIASEITDDLRSIFNFNSLEIDASEDLSTFKLRIDGEPFQLNEIGAGFSQFLVILINVAYQNPHYILIDEPELNLHPRLQNEFLLTLASYAKSGVLFATHNIALAKTGADEIYTVRQTEQGKALIQKYNNTSSLTEFLGEMGYSAHFELGFNKLLLVEGVTEVRTFRNLLKLYNKGRDTVIIPLGGDTLINGKRQLELEEITRITSSTNIKAIVDSEKINETDKSSREAFKENCENLGINCHILERRAIENYFSDNAIKQCLGEDFSALEPFEQLPQYWNKNNNWRIASYLTPDDIKDTDLDNFLANL